LDVGTNRLVVAHSLGPTVATDDPLIQLALRRGPTAFGADVGAQAAALGAVVPAPAPAAWMGMPIAALNTTIGAVSIAAAPPRPCPAAPGWPCFLQRGRTSWLGPWPTPAGPPWSSARETASTS